MLRVLFERLSVEAFELPRLREEAVTPSWCSIHEIDFMSCPCPDRRRTDRLGDLVLVCRFCKVHCSRHDDVACPNPDYDIREAV